MKENITTVTLQTLCEIKGIDSKILDRFDVHEAIGGVEFIYIEPRGTKGRTRLRTSLSGVNGSAWKARDFRPIVMYGNSCHLIKGSRFAFIVEGESDCWVLYNYGYVGIGIPGAIEVNCIDGTQLNQFDDIYIVKENNENHKTFSEGTEVFVKRVNVQ
jgi:hypothetical protein